ncbi:hypothetical protein [Novosphingobium taihuense]|uniref:Uncharacterized protein n=1 Tax=Novosphingobium taihuense TaxID=260085 RepID=A0A7W7ACK6_9SPHN|nr:hypothetical protein [Novosphingobium taihuense]MBB4613799.1 hypothetical protein [Novosphingobium taihuense]
MKKIVVAAGIVVAAVLAVAWIKGGTQPMQWIEQPVTSPQGPVLGGDVQ